MKTKKILIHSLVFSPDGVSTAYLYNDIALAFKESGYDVVVLSTTPHFNVIEDNISQQKIRWGFWGLYKKSFYNSIPVYHVPQKKFKNTFLRVVSFIYWHIVSFFIGLCIKNVDIILSPSPPLTIGRINQFLARIKKCKVVYNVQEIYPDILGKEGSFVHNFLSKMEHKVYNSSDAVTTIDNVFYNIISDRFKDKSKLHIIPNFVDTRLYNSDVSTENLDKLSFPQTNSLKVTYAGNIGFAQDWETLIRLAEKTRDLDIEFFIIGEGVMKRYIEDKKKELDLKKLHILPYQNRNLMPSIIAYSDLQFIFMTPEMENNGFPSKVYTIMACSKALLICSGENTPIVNLLNPIGCAKIVNNHNIENKTDEICRWLSTVTKEKLHDMGAKGKKIIMEHYTKEIVTKQYVDLIDTLLD